MKKTGSTLILMMSCILSVLAQHTATDSSRHETKLFQPVETDAVYMAGAAAWRNLIARNIQPEVPINEGAPAGYYIVTIGFIVGKDSLLSDFKPLTAYGYGMEEEVIRVLKKSGKWIPAQQNGRVVRAHKKQPVTFFVPEDGYEIKLLNARSFYKNAENSITVESGHVQPEDLEITVSEGEVLPAGNGQYTIKTGAAKRIILYLRDKKKKKAIGASSFELIDKPPM